MRSAEFSEIARIMLKSKRGDWLKDWNAILQNAKKELPTELTARETFARRTVMQTTGAGPKPGRILPQYKKRSKLNAERRKERKYINDTDNEEKMQRILGTDRKLLQTCFVLGKGIHKITA